MHLDAQSIYNTVATLALVGAGLFTPTVRRALFRRVAPWAKAVFASHDLVRENAAVNLTNDRLREEVEFVRASRDDYESFVTDLNKRLDFMQEQLNEARADVTSFGEMTRRQSEVITTLFANQDTLKSDNGKLREQLRANGIEPVPASPLQAIPEIVIRTN